MGDRHRTAQAAVSSPTTEGADDQKYRYSGDAPLHALEQGQPDRVEATVKLREVWTVRNGRQMADNTSDIALFNLPVDRKLRACDLVRLTV
jgi:hypothetical protein